jgi:iron complex transport system substrate-binding protein
MTVADPFRRPAPGAPDRRPRRGRPHRGRPVLSLAVTLLVVLSVACSGGDDRTEKTSTGDKERTAADPAAGPFPLTVEHAFGTTEVEAEPERVVSVGFTEHDTLLALGVTPVGVTDWYGDQPFATWPWAQEALGDAEPEVLRNVDGFEYERIAALRPDLIIGTNAGIDEEAYGKLSAIAPTVAHPAGAEMYFSTWDEQSLLIGQALGREAQVQGLVDEVKGRFAEVAEAHPEWKGKRAIFLQNAFYDGEAIAYQDGLSTEFLTDLGFEIPAELDAFHREGEGAQAFIPLEQLSVLDSADFLLWGTEKPSDREALETEPVYDALDAVSSGDLVFTDGLTAGAIYFTSPLSLPFVLDQLVPALEQVVAGDGPATIGGS